METSDARKLHEQVEMVGLRAQATAVGLVQLAVELKAAGVLPDEAIGRIKAAILSDIMLTRPITVPRTEYEKTISRRLDALFSGEERFGPKPFETPPEV